MSIRSSCGEAFRGHFPEKHSSNRSNFIPLAVPVYLMSLWLFPWVGGGGTKEPVITHGAPEAGRDVGLMYSLSSPSDDSFSPLDTADPGNDLSKGRHHRACFFSSVVNDKFEKS